MYNKKILICLALSSLIATSTIAQSGYKSAGKVAVAPYQPTRAEIFDRYKKAAVLDSLARNAVLRYSIQPNWQTGGNAFWYRNFLKDSIPEYFFVDAVTGKKNLLFDIQRLAKAVSELSGKRVEPSKMRIRSLTFESPAKVTILLNEKSYKIDLDTYNVTKGKSDSLNTEDFSRRGGSRSERFRRRDSISPDRNWVAFIKDYNVVIKSVKGESETAFTTDGTKAKPYGTLSWSPDSKYVVGYKIDPREEKEVYYILSSVPGTTRGQLKLHPYAQPGDEFTSYEMYILK